jgi:hypothetical protein
MFASREVSFPRGMNERSSVAVVVDPDKVNLASRKDHPCRIPDFYGKLGSLSEFMISAIINDVGHSITS